MDRAAAALLGPNHLLGQQRYRLATTTIPGNDGDISLKIGEGGLMGDPLMVAHPWSGERMDLSLSQYADDTTKTDCGKPGRGCPGACKASAVL